MFKRGKELEQDEEFQRKVRLGEYHFINENSQQQDCKNDFKAKRSLYIFALGIFSHYFLWYFYKFITSL